MIKSAPHNARPSQTRHPNDQRTRSASWRARLRAAAMPPAACTRARARASAPSSTNSLCMSPSSSAPWCGCASANTTGAVRFPVAKSCPCQSPHALSADNLLARCGNSCSTVKAHAARTPSSAYLRLAELLRRLREVQNIVYYLERKAQVAAILKHCVLHLQNCTQSAAAPKGSKHKLTPVTASYCTSTQHNNIPPQTRR